MHNNHSLIALVSGFAAVNVPTAIDGVITSGIAELILFAAKGLIGGLISVGINRTVDYFKEKRNKSNNTVK